MNGIVLKKVTITGKVLTLNMSSLPPGIYFLQGTAEGQSINHKIIKY
jgi:hypothetical protein